MLSRLIAWLRDPADPIRLAKGGTNPPPTAEQIAGRPPPPAPMRRTTGYQPRDTGPQAPPPRGGSSAVPKRDGVREFWFTEMPQTTMDIPMPPGAVPPRRVPCPCCGR